MPLPCFANFSMPRMGPSRLTRWINADDHASVNELVGARLALREPESIRHEPGVSIAFLRVNGDSWARRMPSRQHEDLWA